MKIHTLLLGISLATAASTAYSTERPNLVVIIADDMAWDDCGAYGHKDIRTPNIDRLAQEGMRFDRAFLTCSSCSPSRCSILTGRYPHATGAGELHLPLPGDQTLFAKALKQAGYYTAALGKWHLGPNVKDQFDVVKEGGNPAGYGHWLPTLTSRPKDKPFFFWLATTDPHRPYQDNTIDQPHTRGDVMVPPFLPDVPPTRADLAMYYDEIGRLDLYVGRVMELLEAQGVADNTVVLFMSDNGRPFPRCKTTVCDDGVRTPFIVRWPKGVESGSVSKSVVSSVDIAPTFLELAGLGPLDTFQGKSFAPILKDPTATTRKYAFAEHNWHDYQAYERGVRSEHFTYIYNALPHLNASPPADAVNSPTYQAMQELHKQGKLAPHQLDCFTVPVPEDKLFDLDNDPYSLNNLADDPAYADVLAEMKAALADWQKRTDDFPAEDLTPDGFDRVTGKRLGKTNRPQ